MKSFVYYAAILYVLSSSQGFTPSSPKSQTNTKLRARADSSCAIDDAMHISKEYGYGSPQARVAWDIVEEIDASDNLRNAFESAAVAAGASGQVSSHASHVQNLHYLLQSAKTTLSQIKTLSSKLKQEDAAPERESTIVRLTDGLAVALAEARAADDILGPNSLEAMQAWDRVQAISSGEGSQVSAGILNLSKTNNRYKEKALEAHHQYYSAVDGKALEDAVDAIGILEHLAKQVSIEHNILMGEGNSKAQLSP